MRCQLCGYEFDALTMVCHTECPLGSHCNLICCPNCGYQVVDNSKSLLARLFRRIWPAVGEPDDSPSPVKSPERQNGVVPLSHIAAGKQVQVQSLGDLPADRLAQLSLFGLTPGGSVEVLQRRPEHVIRIDETELALGKEILDQIWVQV